jgi:hypothetical protein
LRQTLAPALPLAHLLAHGPRIAKKMTASRRKRVPQTVRLAKIAE